MFVRTVLIFAGIINWFIGALIIAYIVGTNTWEAIRKTKLRLILLTFLFGLYGWGVYTY